MISNSRSRQLKRDDQLRRKIFVELSRRKNNLDKLQTKNGILVLSPETHVQDAAKYLVASQANCVLVSDQNSQLCGAVTPTDLVYACCTAKSPRTESIRSCMSVPVITCDVRTDTLAILSKMVQFRVSKMPILDATNEIILIFDILNCLHEVLSRPQVMQQLGIDPTTSRFSSDRDRDDDNEQEQEDNDECYEDIESNASDSSNQLELRPKKTLKPRLIASKHEYNEFLDTMPNRSLGDISVQLLKKIPTVEAKSNAMSAMRLLKSSNSSIVVVLDTENTGNLPIGVVTCADIVLRIIAADVNPSTCSVIRVMTPCPDTVPVTGNQWVPTLVEIFNKQCEKIVLTDMATDSSAERDFFIADPYKLPQKIISSLDTTLLNEPEPDWNKFLLNEESYHELNYLEDVQDDELAEFSLLADDDDVSNSFSGFLPSTSTPPPQTVFRFYWKGKHSDMPVFAVPSIQKLKEALFVRLAELDADCLSLSPEDFAMAYTDPIFGQRTTIKSDDDVVQCVKRSAKRDLEIIDINVYLVHERKPGSQALTKALVGGSIALLAVAYYLRQRK